MIHVKPGVDFNGVSGYALAAMCKAEYVFGQLGLVFTVTSVLDGTHMEGSLHYRGRAFDCRLPPAGGPVTVSLVAKLRAALGSGYDVVLESNHIHVEYDPKD